MGGREGEKRHIPRALPLNRKTVKLLRDFSDPLTLPVVLQKRKLRPREKERPSHNGELKLNSGFLILDHSLSTTPKSGPNPSE